MEFSEKNQSNVWARIDILKLVVNPEFIKTLKKTVDEKDLLELAQKFYNFAIEQ